MEIPEEPPGDTGIRRRPPPERSDEQRRQEFLAKRQRLDNNEVRNLLNNRTLNNDNNRTEVDDAADTKDTTTQPTSDGVEMQTDTRAEVVARTHGCTCGSGAPFLSCPTHAALDHLGFLKQAFPGRWRGNVLCAFELLLTVHLAIR